MEQLTYAQQRVFDAILDYMSQEQKPPTVAELADILGFKSPNAVHQHLKAIARKGYIGFAERGSRNIMILSNTWCAYCGSDYK